MADENINEVLGIEEPQTESKKPSGIFDSDPNETSEPTKASKGLESAANVCAILLWLCVIAGVIGGIMYLANVGDMDSYSDYKRADAILYGGIGAAVFSYGIVGWFSCFILTKVLRGLAVMAEASEKYLAKK